MLALCGGTFSYLGPVQYYIFHSCNEIATLLGLESTVHTMTDFTPVDLFGGALNAALPSTFADVSDIRQVPDHQEVWLDKDGFTSIIFEILERVEMSDPEALKYHLQDLVEEDAGETRVWTSGEVYFRMLP